MNMRRQQGLALLIVMWLITLLAILLGSFALSARTERYQARNLHDTTIARYAAEAGLSQAVFGLMLPDPMMRWLPDGRPYNLEFDGAQIEVRMTDESGLVDLNAADPTLLAALFQSAGLDIDAAESLAAAVVDWRDPDDLLTPNGAEDDDYDNGGYSYGAKDGPFDTVSELQQVMGMTHAFYRQIEPALTIYSGRPVPNPAFAPAIVLQALPGLDPLLAQQLIEARQAFDPSTGGVPPLLPDGTALIAQGGTGTYSVESQATLENGAVTVLDATIRIGGGGLSGNAYSVLRWQDGDSL